MIRFEGRCPYLLIDRAGPTLSRNVCIFILCEYMCIGGRELTCQDACVEVRGHFAGIGSLLAAP